MKELANLRQDYTKHLRECSHNRKKGANLNTTTGSSEDERTTRSDGTQLTEPEVSSSTKSPGQRAIEAKSAPVIRTAATRGKLGHTAVLRAHSRPNRDRKLGHEAKKNKET
jgi:hypothetical protein